MLTPVFFCSRVHCIKDQQLMTPWPVFIFGKKNNEFLVFVPVTVLRRTHQGCGRCVLTGLVLCSLDPGLQVSRGMEVLALVSAAATFNVVHADNDRVLAAVHHASLQGVSVTAVALTPCAVTTLEFSTNLEGPGGSTDQHLPFIIHT